MMKPNIISNCCLGAFIMRDLLHLEYNKPFVWGWISAEGMLSIIQNYFNINWNNVSLSTYENKELQDGVCFTVHVDNTFALTYSHYQFNANYDFFTDNKTNMVFSNHIWEYVIAKYKSRTLRMVQANIPPKYIILDDFTEKTFSNEQIYRLNTNSKYPVLLFTPKDIDLDNPLIKVINICQDDMLPELIALNYKEVIMQFLYLDS